MNQTKAHFYWIKNEYKVGTTIQTQYYKYNCSNLNKKTQLPYSSENCSLLQAHSFGRIGLTHI